MNTSNGVNSFEINRNDLVLIIGESIGTNSTESLKLAQGLACGDSHGTVLFVNSYQRPHKFQLTVKEALGQEYNIKNNSDNLRYMSCVAGSLPERSSAVEDELKNGVSTIVINCWELVSRDGRLKERLLFQILHWMHVYTATVILYAQKSSAIPKPGYAQRGGFGRLAGVADRVVRAFEEEGSLRGGESSTLIEKVELPNRPPQPLLQKEGLSNLIETEGLPNNEVIEEYTSEISEGDAAIRAWDEMKIPRKERRVYFLGVLKNSGQIVEERLTKHQIHTRSVEVEMADYDFPETLPYELTPEVGITLEAYLGRYLKQRGDSENVRNDVEGNQGVTGQVLRLAA